MTSLPPDTLGSRIREARKAAGYKNVESIAVLIGVGFRTFQRWEQDKAEPSITRLREIAALTDQTLAHFIAAPDDEVAA